MYTTLIAAADLKDILQQPNLVIIDSRHVLSDTESGRKDYQKSHIPTAQFAHLDEDLSGDIIAGKTGRHPFPSVEKMTQKLSNWGIDEQAQVVVYDQSHGGIAARLWFMLKWLGHEKVAVLDGGWKNWKALGYPTDGKIPAINPKTFTPKPSQDLIVDVNFMEQNIDKQNYIYIDSRTSNRYSGAEEPIDPVAGHIPSAINAPWPENLGADGLFLSKEQLATRFVNILKDQPKGKAIFYCGSGVTACHNLLVLRHVGITSPKLFPGSWSEWIVDKNREVVTSEPNP